MKKFGITLVLALGILAVLAVPAWAFHDEGVARCNGCHTMHNSEDGALVDPTAPNGNAYLLRFSKPTDVCLSCHTTNHGKVWGTDPLNPPTNYGAGNFVFLQEDNINDGRAGSTPIPGRAAGHNVISATKSSGADPVQTRAPGGTYPASAMSCTSCHDPHGNTNFRLLYGAGHVIAGNYTFTNAAPDAEGISESSTAPGESQTNHTAYKGGMSAWCANCHGNFHQNSVQMRHKSGVAMGGDIAQIYNQYNGTVDQFGGNAATSYVPQVAFEDEAMTTTSTAGPTETSQVSCISCHRAHATSAPNAGRWDFNVQFQNQDGLTSGSYPIPNAYTSADQRSMCNKCHNMDANDHFTVTP